jgi:hypothetical protein
MWRGFEPRDDDSDNADTDLRIAQVDDHWLLDTRVRKVPADPGDGLIVAPRRAGGKLGKHSAGFVQLRAREPEGSLPIPFGGSILRWRNVVATSRNERKSRLHRFEKSPSKRAFGQWVCGTALGHVGHSAMADLPFNDATAHRRDSDIGGYVIGNDREACAFEVLQESIRRLL